MEYENKFVGRTYMTEFEITSTQRMINECIALALAPSDIWYN